MIPILSSKLVTFPDHLKNFKEVAIFLLLRLTVFPLSPGPQISAAPLGIHIEISASL